MQMTWIRIFFFFNHDRFLHTSNEKCGEYLLCAEISPHDRICQNLRRFVAKSVWSQFTLFCVGKMNQKLCLSRKKERQISGMPEDNDLIFLFFFNSKNIKQAKLPHSKPHVSNSYQTGSPLLSLDYDAFCSLTVDIEVVCSCYASTSIFKLCQKGRMPSCSLVPSAKTNS